MKHTPTPWELNRPCMSDPHNEHSYDIFTPTHDGRCHHVGEIDLNSAEPAVANAEHIIRAVNSFDELLAALKIALAFTEQHKAALIGMECSAEEYEAAMKTAASAIAKAEAEPI